MKQKQYRLNDIIKNCKYAEFQLSQLKKSLKFQANLSVSCKPEQIKVTKSISLLKSSRMHIDNFQRRHFKMNSFQDNIPHLHKTSKNSPEQRRKKSSQNNTKFNSLDKNQKRQNAKQKSSLKPQTPKQQTKSFLPNISSMYRQTFKPKNASLSQHSMIQRQLQNSIVGKRYNKQNKIHNKQNVMKEYQSQKSHKQDKLDHYRLVILKKISQQNVKKYLIKKSLNKQKKLMLQLKEKKFTRSYILEN